MIYYKITDKESDLYKTLYEQRTKELEARKENEELLEKLIPYKWEIYSGHRDNSYSRIPRYFGFKFENPDEVDMNVWKRDRSDPEMFVPNRKTRAGKRMATDLENLKYFSFIRFMEMLEITDYCGRWVVPAMEIAGDAILVEVDDKHELKQPEAIMITKNEYFDILREAGFEIE